MQNLQRAKGYRERADELRAIADTMTDWLTSQTIRRLADSYDRMAVRIERSDKDEE
jgi:hypothetical protein